MLSVRQASGEGHNLSRAFPEPRRSSGVAAGIVGAMSTSSARGINLFQQQIGARCSFCGCASRAPPCFYGYNDKVVSLKVVFHCRPGISSMRISPPCVRSSRQAGIFRYRCSAVCAYWSRCSVTREKSIGFGQRLRRGHVNSCSYAAVPSSIVFPSSALAPRGWSSAFGTQPELANRGEPSRELHLGTAKAHAVPSRGWHVIPTVGTGSRLSPATCQREAGSMVKRLEAGLHGTTAPPPHAGLSCGANSPVDNSRKATGIV